MCVCGVRQAPRAELCSGAADRPYSSHAKHTYRKFAVTAVAGARRHRRLRGVGTCPGTDVHANKNIHTSVVQDRHTKFVLAYRNTVTILLK